ncbi:hypothetical protein Agabi119p4_6838 [Agaricus bisporus var. burnettii]|uniref:Integrase catalytic domain-containing protein n=2 Tax=Agaricus bisporus var. burnettii TaxID=192524 RepID=A0A8H7F097_AGABI|nr:hypothetical protein Agabi119p4_6838 [Agaricus bisporus var. burnettii]
MSSTGGNAPPIFADMVKFNGSNWVSWNNLIRIAAELRGVSGYLDGSIADPAGNPLTTPIPPSPPNTTTTPQTTPPTFTPAETPWESTAPSAAEWRVRNAWAKGLLIYNTDDPVGLGINIHGNAAEAWKSYVDTYEVASEVALLNAELELRNMIYADDQDFTQYISKLRTKWSNATALGAKIDDKAFRTIILNSLPRSWDPIVATLYTTQSSREAINQLMTHWARISRNRPQNSQSTTTALQTSSDVGRDRSRSQNQQLHCTNQNCNRRGHTIDNCYWPGGGKAGQFPPGFGKRGGSRASTNNTTLTGQTSANAVNDNSGNGSNEPTVFALATIAPESTENISNVSTKTILTLLDSGASDHCVVQRDCFIQYKPVLPPRLGNSAGEGSTFNIDGSGTAVLWVNGREATSKILLGEALHTPQLRSNLISVSKLVAKGYKVNFEGGSAFVRSAGRMTVMEATKVNGLYVIPVGTNVPAANAIQTKRKAVPFEIWHRRLGHVGVEVLKRMTRDKLVDGLNVEGDAEMKGMCEDCIYGKHATHPFNGQTVIETEPLQRVYVDLWGPSPVQSAGGAKYFMLIMDGATSYRKAYFISNKSAEATLNVFKEFHREAERQTGRKLKRVRLDMGREWHNALWDEYVKSHGIVLDFSTPYAHQQNGKAERSMRTLLDMARTLLSDSSLPQKYWADSVQTAVYLHNFIPPTRLPDQIPAEKWFGRRQDVSHLRPFGSTCYAHVPVEASPDKLSPRSVKLTLIGFFDHTGYKLLDRSTGKAFRSRDVIFEESKPHYSTDPLITYPSTNDDTPRAVDTFIAPQPKHITSLHPTATPMTTPVVSTPAGAGDSDGAPVTDTSTPVRRSQRDRKPSQKMLDSMEYLGRPMAGVVSTLDDTTVPKSYHDAMKRADLWVPPMLKELTMMEEKGVFKLVPRPVGKNVVKSRWVFANKYNELGEVIDRKARLVAKGFTQVLGEDYDETYALVARLESVRLVCAVAAAKRLRLWQLDFVSAFLNSDNVFEIYMEQPQGFEEGGDKVWLLLKTLYGTMQGAHNWAFNLNRTYEGHGYYVSRADSQIRSKVEDTEFTLTSTWTDDILGASSTEMGEMKAKEELGNSYEVKDLGVARFILGMRIDRDEKDGTIRLSQRSYCERILDRFNMGDATPKSTPLPPGIDLSTVDSTPQSDDEVNEMKEVPY